MENTVAPNERLMNEIFHDQLYPRWFSHLRQPHAMPRVIFVGGQPGVGKSVHERAITEALREREPDTVVEINGDDYRAFHPRYWEHMQQDDVSAAAKIDNDNSRFIEMAIQASLAIRCHAVVEGTFRQPAVVTKTADTYRQAEYASEAILLAVHPILSELGILQRYTEQKIIAPYARYSSPEAHQAAVAGIPTAISEIITKASVDKLSIVEKGGKVLFDNSLKHVKHDARKLLARDALAVIAEKYTTLKSEELAFARTQFNDLQHLRSQVKLPLEVVNRLVAVGRELSKYEV